MRYHFDLENGGRTVDAIGTECSSFEKMRCKAMALTAEVAADAPHDTDRYSVSVQVRDETGKPCYRATLIIVGRSQ